MPIKVGINGFGRIGRNIVRASLGNSAIEFVAVNDITDSKTLAHLLKYDSVLGNLHQKVTHTEDSIAVDGKSFRVFKTKDPGEIDWPSVGADIVIESTGLFTKASDAAKHKRGTVKKVIISAPATDEDLTVVLGVNDKIVRPGQASHHLERVLHDQLPRSRRESDSGHIRDFLRHDDDDPLLHERPETARPAAQGFAARPRGGAFHDSHFDRGGQGAAPGHPGAERETRRLFHPRPYAERERCRPDGVHGKAGDGERGERRAQERGRWPDEEHPRIHGGRTGFHRLPRQSAFLDCGFRLYARGGNELREGSRVV